MEDKSEVSGANYIFRKTGLASAGGNETIAVPKTAFNHQVSLATVAGSPAAGSVQISAVPLGGDTFEDIQGGAIDMTAPLTVIFNGYFERVKLTWSSFDGSSFAIVLAGGA